jgi:predicted O-methyltransferase YrrM
MALATKSEKSIYLLSLLVEEPSEFVERAKAIAQVIFDKLRRLPAYAPQSEESALAGLENLFGAGIRDSLQDVALADIEASVAEKSPQVLVEGPFCVIHNGDRLLARTCYALARVSRPRIAVETGVCYGVTSSYLLQALRENGSGALHSIDLPPLAKREDEYVGRLVPNGLRERWMLHRGTSRRLLPPLLQELGQIDLFVHDSLHTYRNMKLEFAAAWRALRGGGVLISDDIEGNRAFLELALRDDVALSVVMQGSNKKELLGVAVKRE